MAYSLLTVTLFRKVFNGNTTVKGVTTTKDIVTSEGKLEANSYLDKSALSNDDIIAHLNGIKGVGMAPINEQGKVGFGVIDIDSYNGSVDVYIKTIYTFNFPIIPFYSKSKGLHAYVFFKEPVTPDEAIDLLIRMRQTLGLPKDTEIFPKQRAVTKGGFASWINLPYFDAANPDNPRKLIKEDGSLANIEEALRICEQSARDIAEFNKAIDELPMNDAPPCLQTIYLLRQTDFRNEYLYGIGVYCKHKYEDNFEQELLEINSKLDKPLDENEIRKTILKSMQKKEYSYKCNVPPCNLLCSKALCRERKYGIEGETITNLSYEDLIQYNTDPPYYEWFINGVALKFFKESEIIQQNYVQELCMRKLHILPPQMTKARWFRIVNTALSNVIVKEVEKESDVSTGGVWLEYVTEFFTNRVPATNKKQIKIDRVYNDEYLGAYIFKGNALLEYLRKQKNFRQFSDVEIQSRLKDMGARQVMYDIDDGNILNLWSMPFASIPKRNTMSLNDIDIDFFDKESPDDKY